MDLTRQVAHLLRQSGETYPAPLIGGFVAETRADNRVNVYWRVSGKLGLWFLRMRALRRYERILAGFGMATALHADGPEPYLACWMPERRSVPAQPGMLQRSADERTRADERRALALSR